MSSNVEVTISSTTGSDWDKLARQYERPTENPTSGAVNALIKRVNLRLAFSEATGILDNGCGPGGAMSALLNSYGQDLPQTCSLLCSDFSGAMIEQVQQTKMKQVEQGNSIWSRVNTITSDAMDMQAVSPASQSHVLAGAVYFMTPKPQKCLSESMRMLKAGGVLGLTSWAGNQWMQIMFQLGVACPNRQMPSLPEEWATPGAVQIEMEKAGFVKVESVPIVVYMGYESHAELVRFLLQMPHMVALSKGLSDEEMGQVEAAMLKEAKELNPQEPGRLSGDAIVAVGTKEMPEHHM